jgi:hypothetical protein
VNKEAILKGLILLTTLFIISACSSTGVSPFAAGTYKIEASHVMAASAKEKAYEEATSFCSAKKKKMEIISEPDQVSERYSIIFQCV